MIVASNSSPIMNLAVVGQVHLLERLYGKVYISEAVWQELSAMSMGQPWAAVLPTLAWLETRSVSHRSLVDSLLLELDKGEAEAICLAIELKADLLLVDERGGRTLASRLRLKFIGLLGALVEGKRKGYIAAVKPTLDDLVTHAGFWLSDHLYARILREVGEYIESSGLTRHAAKGAWIGATLEMQKCWEGDFAERSGVYCQGIPQGTWTSNARIPLHLGVDVFVVIG